MSAGGGPRPKAWLLAHLSDAELLEEAGALDASTSDQAGRVRIWLLDTLEERHPELVPWLEAWVEEPHPAESYVEACARGLRELGLV